MTFKRAAIIFHAITTMCPMTNLTTTTKKAIDPQWKCVDSGADKLRCDSCEYRLAVI